MEFVVKKSTLLYSTLLPLAFVLGAFSQHLPMFEHQQEALSHIVKSKQIREHRAGESLINPLLECEVAEGMIDVYKENFHDELEVAINEMRRMGDANTVAVYFRDLNNGPTFGIRETEDFVPASLLKVPVMMSYLRLAEEDPQILNKEILYEKKITLDDAGSQLIPPSTEIEVGKKYAVQELIRRTISYSDNPAVTLLIYNLPPEPILHLYQMLGVRNDVLKNAEGRLTVKEYAAFFRILFNSSYLSHKNSIWALDLLTKTEFDKGLRAGVPEHVTVAHKFGEGGTDYEHQIHDCGIVYYPNHPYLLCVMSRGSDITRLENSIAKVSAFIYAKIDNVYGVTTPK